MEKNSYYACSIVYIHYSNVSAQYIYLQGILILQKEEINNEFSSWGERTQR